MNFLNFKKVLCISAHPDDAEYGMLGSMIKCRKTKFDVAVLSNGGDYDETTGERRRSECRGIWSNLDNVNGDFVDSIHIKDNTEDGWINKIENKYNIGEYDVIFTTPYLDSHFEHRIANKISWALIRNSRCGLITYKAPSTSENWKPNYYISIDDFLSRKRIMLENFKSQKDKSYFKIDSINAFHSNYIGSKIGISYVEHFKIERVFGL